MAAHEENIPVDNDAEKASGIKCYVYCKHVLKPVIILNFSKEKSLFCDFPENKKLQPSTFERNTNICVFEGLYVLFREKLKSK